MAIDTTPSQVATSALQALPFGSIIGGPLKAAIEAQAMAAKTSWNFIQEVGLNTDPDTGEKKTINVSFQFVKDGRIAQFNVPLLTIVPIPYIAIQTVDIAFKANISASSSSTTVENKSSTLDAGISGGGGVKVLGLFDIHADFYANYSSKKDSTATQDSKYSVEYTMDVAVKAGQDSMPAGLAKVLELLGNSLDVCDPKGTLEVNALEFKGSPSETFMLIATYKNPEGIFEPEKIQIPGETGEVDGDSKIFNLKVKEGKPFEYIVGVSGSDKKVIVKTIDTYTDQAEREKARLQREKEDSVRIKKMQDEIAERRKEIDEANSKELVKEQKKLEDERKKQEDEQKKQEKDAEKKNPNQGDAKN